MIFALNCILFVLNFYTYCGLLLYISEKKTILVSSNVVAEFAWSLYEEKVGLMLPVMRITCWMAKY